MSDDMRERPVYIPFLLILVIFFSAPARADSGKELFEKECTGCHACFKNCPVKAISGTAKAVHHIDQKICIKCGMCYEVCKFNAIFKG